ncbi:glycogen synthase 2 [Clostridium sp. CAG:1013]|nr:glycogen synthase 2 [Clostridium sp. CAG:1013]
MARKKADPAKKKPAAKKTPTPAVEKETPTVVTAAPAPAEEKPAPVEEKAAPVAKKEETPVKEPAAVKAPVAAEEKPAPVEEKAIPAAKKEETPAKETAAVKAPAPTEEKPAPVEEKVIPAAKKEETPAKEPAAVKAPVATEEKPAPKKTTRKKAASSEKKAETAPKKTKKKAAPAPEEPAPVAEETGSVQVMSDLPRRSVAFIGSECHPFVKTGGLGDVMFALPRELVRLNCDVRVILPRYACIPQKYQDKMIYRGEFYMDLGNTGRQYYVGIMEYIWDGVVYDFIDNQEFFSSGNPYLNLVDDIPKYCFFSKAALAALNYMNWIPDIIHCHDWQAGLVPVYLRTLFQDSPVGRAKSILTIHNLRFQGIYNIPTIQYWSGLPDDVFNMGALKQDYEDANMFKGGLAYADRITTVSGTYAQEIQTSEYGEHLDGHLRYHNYKLRGIVNGIDYDMWNPETDPALAVNYGLGNVLDHKMENKLALQKELGLEEDESKFVIGLISRLTNQKGLDLVSTIIPQVLDGNTQIVILGTGDKQYEDTFRYYESVNKGTFAACIQYDEARAHRIYAGADALLVPSRFEPCGLTQLNAMHYGTIPIVRETGGLKDTVEPYNTFTGDGNGFTFDRYDAGLLLDAINRAKTEYFTNRYHWDEVVQRDMAKDVSWENSAKQYKDLYLELTQW